MRAVLWGAPVIRVVVAESHDYVRHGIVVSLNSASDIEVVGEANTSDRVIHACKQLSPDVVLLDYKVPGIGGIEATRRITDFSSSIKVIGIGLCGRQPFPSLFLKAGASAYLSKHSGLEEILSAIRQVHQGGLYLGADVAGKLALDSLAGYSSPFERLSGREIQIAIMLAECKSVSDIAQLLSISSKTVNTHRYRIFEKLGLGSDIELAWLALQYGMVELPLAG